MLKVENQHLLAFPFQQRTNIAEAKLCTQRSHVLWDVSGDKDTDMKKDLTHLVRDNNIHRELELLVLFRI